MFKTVITASGEDSKLMGLLNEVREYAHMYTLARDRKKGCDEMGELATVREEFRDALEKMLSYASKHGYAIDGITDDLDAIARAL